MKFFAYIALIVALSVVDAAVTQRMVDQEGIEGVESANQQKVTHVESTKVGAENDVVRMRKSAKPSYGAAYPGPATTYTYPSPAPTVPCGKNLLFSCQPSVAPVPCYAPPPTYSAPSYAGAYSHHVAQWAYPPVQ